MAFEELTFTARLWQQLGLRLLLRDTPVPLQDSLLKYGQVRSRPPRADFFRPEVARRARSGQLPSRIPKSAKVRETPPQRLARHIPTDEHWPEPWKKLLSQVAPGRVVWTYAQLGSDLLGLESPGLELRRAFLKRLLSERPLYPAGTHTFWPYLLPLGETPVPQVQLFWQGVHLLGARVVFLLGVDAGESLLACVNPFAFKRENGVFSMVVQSIDELAKDQPLYTLMQNMVRGALAQQNIYPRED